MKVQETSRGVEIFEFLGFGNTISAIGCSFELFSIINTENCLRLECAYWQTCTNRGGGRACPLPHPPRHNYIWNLQGESYSSKCSSELCMDVTSIERLGTTF